MFSTWSAKLSGLPARADFNPAEMIRPAPEPDRFDWQDIGKPRASQQELRPGDRLTFAGVNRVNPERYEVSGVSIVRKMQQEFNREFSAEAQDYAFQQLNKMIDRYNGPNTRLDVLYGLPTNAPEQAVRIGDELKVRLPMRYLSPRFISDQILHSMESHLRPDTAAGEVLSIDQIGKLLEEG